MKIKHFWNDSVRDNVTAGVILAALTVLAGVLYKFVPSFREWVIHDLGNISRLQVIGWFLLGGVLGGIACYALIRRRLIETKNEATKARTQLAAPRASQVFQPIRVEDKTLNLEWRIMITPTQWADNHKLKDAPPSYHLELLAGPYHLAKDCSAELQTSYNDGSTQVYSECRSCGGDTFKSPSFNLLFMRERTLAELQRMHRNGKSLSGTVVLENPEYWKFLAPDAIVG